MVYVYGWWFMGIGWHLWSCYIQVTAYLKDVVTQIHCKVTPACSQLSQIWGRAFHPRGMSFSRHIYRCAAVLMYVQNATPLYNYRIGSHNMFILTWLKNHCCLSQTKEAKKMHKDHLETHAISLWLMLVHALAQDKVFISLDKIKQPPILYLCYS